MVGNKLGDRAEFLVGRDASLVKRAVDRAAVGIH